MRSAARRNVIWLVTLFVAIGGLGAVAWRLRLVPRGDRTRERPDFFQLCAANLVGIGDAIRDYHVETGRYPQSLKELVPKYLKGVPECPVALRDTYSRGYEHNAAGFTLYCTAAHKIWVSGRGEVEYWQYTSSEGLVRRSVRPKLARTELTGWGPDAGRLPGARPEGTYGAR